MVLKPYKSHQQSTLLHIFPGLFLFQPFWLFDSVFWYLPNYFEILISINCYPFTDFIPFMEDHDFYV